MIMPWVLCFECSSWQSLINVYTKWSRSDGCKQTHWIGHIPRSSLPAANLMAVMETMAQPRDSMDTHPIYPISHTRRYYGSYPWTHPGLSYIPKRCWGTKADQVILAIFRLKHTQTHTTHTNKHWHTKIHTNTNCHTHTHTHKHT